MKVSIFQVQRKEPVPWVYLRGDLFQCGYPESPFHEGAVHVSEIEDGPEASILFRDEEVTAVETQLALNWRNHFLSSFCQ